MARYHINPRTGNPGICRAKKSCPFGDLATAHYSSKTEARRAYEAAMVSSHEALDLHWDSLSQDKKLTILAGMERTKYNFGSRERTYWDAVYCNTEAGKLWLERKRAEDAYEYPSMVTRAEEVGQDLPLPSEPEVPRITLQRDFLPKNKSRPTLGRDDFKVEQRQLAYLSALWISRLTPEETEAVAWMTSNGFNVVRQHLAGQEPDIWGYDVYSREHLDSTYENFQSAMAKAPILPEPIVIYRGTSLDHITPEITIPRNGTISPSVAFGFASRGLDKPVPAILEIKTRKVASPVAVSAWGMSELEVFAPLGTYGKLDQFEQYYGSSRKKWNEPLPVVQLEYQLA